MEKVGRLIYNIRTKSYEIDHNQNIYEKIYAEECFMVLVNGIWIKASMNLDNNGCWYLAIDKNLHGLYVKIDETSI